MAEPDVLDRACGSWPRTSGCPWTTGTGRAATRRCRRVRSAASCTGWASRSPPTSRPGRPSRSAAAPLAPDAAAVRGHASGGTRHVPVHVPHGSAVEVVGRARGRLGRADARAARPLGRAGAWWMGAGRGGHVRAAARPAVGLPHAPCDERHLGGDLAARRDAGLARPAAAARRPARVGADGAAVRPSVAQLLGDR